MPACWPRMALPICVQLCHADARDADDPVAGPDARLGGRRRRIALDAARVHVGRHAGLDGADRGPGAGGLQADARGDHEQQHQGQHEVHERAGREHDDPLPARLLAERPRLVGRVHVLQVGHPDDLDETTGRDGLDAVLGLALLARPDGPPEADEELGGLHAEQLGRREVARLMQHDRREQGHDEDGNAEQEAHPAVSPLFGAVPTACCVRCPQAAASSEARARAQPSAARTSARLTASPARPSCSETTCATVSTIAANGSLPARNASTQTSLAAL